MENMDLALIVLLTGLVVVFAALIVLTFVIKGYGMIITSITSASKKKKAEAQATKKAAQEATAKPAAPVAKPAAPTAPAAPAVQEGIPGEVIAAIAAAVDYTYGAGTHTIRAVRRVPQNRSAWGSAGLAESTRPF